MLLVLFVAYMVVCYCQLNAHIIIRNLHCVFFGDLFQLLMKMSSLSVHITPISFVKDISFLALILTGSPYILSLIRLTILRLCSIKFILKAVATASMNFIVRGGFFPKKLRMLVQPIMLLISHLRDDAS